VVFCLVDLYLVLGDDLVPYLSSLTTSQKKLVTIYINRAKNKSPSPSSSDALGMG
jgi:CLIP-associating protein 1/2